MVIDIVLFLHYLYILRLNEHAYFRARQELMVVLHHKFITILRLYSHLVMNALENATVNHTIPLRELTFRHTVFGIIIFLTHNPSAFLVFLAPNINIFWTNNHIHWIILAKAFVNTIKLLVAELHTFIANHRAAQYITLTNKICHKAVLRLVVYIGWRSNLLNLTFTHHYHAVTQRQCLFLVMRYVDKSNTQLLVHLLQLQLHVLAHLQIQCRQWFIK